jgi:hypothetical protein
MGRAGITSLNIVPSASKARILFNVVGIFDSAEVLAVFYGCQGSFCGT